MVLQLIMGEIVVQQVLMLRVVVEETVITIGGIPGGPHFTPHKALNGGHIFLTLSPTLTSLSYILEGLE